MGNTLNRKLMNEAFTRAVRENTDSLLKQLSRFDYPEFNHKPSAAGWSAGEIAEHILLLDIRLNSILSGAMDHEERDPQEKIEEMVRQMADLENKMEAPAFLVPSTATKNPEALINKIIASRYRLLQATRNQNLTLFLPSSPHPDFGVLSGIEWLNYLIHHTNRHLEQLRKINK